MKGIVVQPEQNGTGTITNMSAVFAMPIIQTSGDVLTARSIVAALQIGGGGCVGDFQGMYIVKPIPNGGSRITNSTAILIDDFSAVGSGNNYAIRSVGGNIVMVNGYLGVGTQTPSVDLDVNGHSAFRNYNLIYDEGTGNNDGALVGYWGGSRGLMGGNYEDMAIRPTTRLLISAANSTTPTLVISTNGVGINTNAPQTSLDVNGVSTFHGYQIHRASNHTLAGYMGSGNGLIYGAGDSDMAIRAVGTLNLTSDNHTNAVITISTNLVQVIAPIQADDYIAGDGTPTISTNFTVGGVTWTVKNGLVTGVSY
jgi:hypothetical protein